MAQSSNRILVLVLGQLSQRTTILAIVNAGALLAGLHLPAEQLEAVAVLLSVLDTVALAVVQERGSPAVVVSDVAVVDSKGPVTVNATAASEQAAS